VRSCSNRVSEKEKVRGGAQWEDIIGMRHRLVHAYFDINLHILWRTVEEDLPALASILEPRVPSEAP